jgi:hypothetical protein
MYQPNYPTDAHRLELWAGILFAPSEPGRSWTKASEAVITRAGQIPANYDPSKDFIYSDHAIIEPYQLKRPEGEDGPPLVPEIAHHVINLCETAEQVAVHMIGGITTPINSKEILQQVIDRIQELILEEDDE